MKTLKEREWFFAQEKEEFSATNPCPVYDLYRLKTTRQVICDIRIDSGLSLEKETVIGAVADLHFNSLYLVLEGSIYSLIYCISARIKFFLYRLNSSLIFLHLHIKLFL